MKRILWALIIASWIIAGFVRQGHAAERCILKQAMHNLEYYNVQLNGQKAEEQCPLLEEMRQLTYTAKDQNLPIGQQLTRPQLQRFNQIRFQLIQHQAIAAVNSGYLRDARVIAKAADMAHQFRLGRTLPPNSPDFTYWNPAAICGR
jgi:hypothetical protein